VLGDGQNYRQFRSGGLFGTAYLSCKQVQF